MFIAHIQTASGPLTIGLTSITLEQTNATFSALLEMLSQVTDPIEVTRSDVYLREAPDDTPATMTFKYLGASSMDFADQAAYAAAMNKLLSLSVFACAMDIRAGEGELITVDFESFELLGEEKVGDPEPPAH